MRKLKAFLTLTVMIFCMYACKKAGSTAPGSVVGKWNIVNVTTRGQSYMGQPGDYFNFTADGNLYTKEGAKLDTFTYTMRADSAIVMTPPAYTNALSEFGSITTFTANSLQINGPYPITPGGLITGGSSIVLSR